ncbi:MAG: hypothetical protein ACREIF_03475 [Chthoniobacterales bacterium]
MKRLTLFIPVMTALALVLSSCASSTNKSGATEPAPIRGPNAVEQTPTTTSTTVTRQSAGGY